MSACPSCGAPISIGGVFPFTAQYTCMCRFNSRPAVGQITFGSPTPAEREQGCKPATALTEADVHRIVAEMMPSIEHCRIAALKVALKQIVSRYNLEDIREIANEAMRADDKLARGEG